MKIPAAPLMPALCCALLGACAGPSLPTSPSHISEAPQAAGAIPETVQQSTALRPPAPAAKLETYSVTVHKVPVQSLLFALARDAGMNVDIHPGIDGSVTLNALNQTLPQLLTRISRQVDMRYEIDGKNLTVLPDTAVWRHYKVDYVNIARSTNSSVNIATQISTAGGGSSAGGGAGAAANSGGAGSAGGNNNSTTSVLNKSENNFWYSLERNIRDLLRETTLGDPLTDPLAQMAQSGAGQGQYQSQYQSSQNNPNNQNQGQNPLQGGQQNQGQYAQNPPAGGPNAVQGGQGQQPGDASAALKMANKGSPSSVVVNVEGGLIAVRATGRQHEKIQEFMDIVLSSAKRQVLIEATIIEVRLSDQYQQGINWSRLRGPDSGLSVTQKQVGNTALLSAVTPGATPGLLVLDYLNPTSRLGNIAATIQLLESFGKVKVLSSPKISVLNNQTALLKVVDNQVFFTIKVTPAVYGLNNVITTPATYESRLETVPVGFVMSVTPQIADSDEVTLNVRPTITRIVGYVQDPNPELARGSTPVVSKVPVIQARELESIMKVSSGQVAVMGGLMQDSVDNNKDSVPGVGRIPILGDLFSYRNESSSKTELVIFIRPVVVKDASINGDYKDYRYLLPSAAPAQPAPRTAPAAQAYPAVRADGT
ncbi:MULTISPECIES: type II secretion system protein GspD [unclassified Janthinobacterium]|uniref:type II secretion system protein GspD n=1 Tax=unclassified Janthinobacterium TaxID=2610881 RepID=UPI00034D55BA|nr:MULTISPECIES: secretin N-terminal domain-containing protein [unclassified Janthinobacterium]MEC5160294.1 MSHA biogenesis protein MshL [Janthinobacterium sp. CG_S6]